MRFFSAYMSMDFADALLVVKEALKRQKVAILAEIDMREVLRQDLSVEFRPYVVLSACSSPLTERTIRAADAIGPMLMCHFIVQEHRNGCVEVSTADPDCTIGAINHVELISICQEMRSLVRKVICDIGAASSLTRAA